MNKPNANALCAHCNERATTTHILNGCFMTQMIRKSFIKFFDEKGMKSKLIQDETFFEFFWWDPKTWSHSQYKELWSVWAETRKHAHQCDFLPKFYRFGPQQFMAKVVTAFRKAAKVAFLKRFKLAAKVCKFVINLEVDQFQHWYIEIHCLSVELPSLKSL